MNNIMKLDECLFPICKRFYLIWLRHILIDVITITTVVNTNVLVTVLGSACPHKREYDARYSTATCKWTCIELSYTAGTNVFSNIISTNSSNPFKFACTYNTSQVNTFISYPIQPVLRYEYMHNLWGEYTFREDHPTPKIENIIIHKM